MAIDIANLLSVSNNSLYNTSLTNKQSSSLNFTDVLLNALGGKTSATDENPLYTALTSATNTDLYTQNSSYLDYLSNNSGTPSSLEGYLSNYSSSKTSSEQVSNALIASFQGQMLHTLSAAKTKLADHMAAYEAKIGEQPSEAAKLRLVQLQKNVSILDDFITTKQSENSLLDQLNNSSSLTQYLVHKNQSTL